MPSISPFFDNKLIVYILFFFDQQLIVYIITKKMQVHCRAKKKKMQVHCLSELNFFFFTLQAMFGRGHWKENCESSQISNSPSSYSVFVSRIWREIRNLEDIYICPLPNKILSPMQIISPSIFAFKITTLRSLVTKSSLSFTKMPLLIHPYPLPKQTLYNKLPVTYNPTTKQTVKSIITN